MMLYGSVELLSKIIDIIDLFMDFCVREGLPVSRCLQTAILPFCGTNNIYLYRYIA